MAITVKRYNGKLKREIADEAFQQLGPKATAKQVDAHFREYGLPNCKPSMYRDAKSRFLGKPLPPSKMSSIDRMESVVKRLRVLAEELGGYDYLLRVVNVIKP